MQLARCSECSWSEPVKPGDPVPGHECAPDGAAALTCPRCPEWRRELNGAETPELVSALRLVHGMRPGH